MKKRYYAVSNAHLDTQWNWTIKDTIEQYIKNTLEENFRNFRHAPKYRFNFEGAFKYKLMKEYYPDHYQKMKKHIAEGRWCPSGAFWDSCDVNVPSSEALMRQALLGNKFFEKEFGVFTKDIFLPDCFGFRSSIPSIAKHMGLIGFSTQKLTWGVGCPVVNEDGSVSRPEEGEHTRLDLGKWKGPDGEEIFVSLDGGAYVYQYPEEDTPVDKRDWILKDIEHNEKVSGFPWRNMYFGVGDRGGGCTVGCARMVSDAEESSDGLYEVKNAHTYEIFEDLQKEDTSALPTYEGHLLIPHGYGALTSHTISKRFNRLCENLADAAEKASVLAMLHTDHPYPKDKLNEAWKTFLWHQFHDDLTGTSICSAYVFSHNDYAIALNMFATELGASIDAVSQLLDTTCDGTPIVLFNPSSACRTSVVKAILPVDGKYLRVFNENGEEVPSQISTVDGVETVIFEATVDAVGVAVYSVLFSDTPSTVTSTLSVTESTLENRYYRVSINENGDIASVFDKELGKELLSAPSRLEIINDTSNVWPSWELNYEDLNQEPEYVKDEVSVEIEENGAAEVSLKVTRKYGESVFVQHISLSSCEKTVSVSNFVNWHSCHSLLKATFPLTASNPIAEFDLGLGADKGGNTDSYPYFQHCVHTWADLTDQSGDYGVGILNDCKYGMDKPNDNTLRLTLIHTPEGAYGETDSHQDWQDFGRNEFRYAITSHAGERNGVALLAEEFNKPIIPFETGKHSGKRKKLSLVTSDNHNVLIRAVKAEEDGNRIILRIQETAGKDSCVNLTFGNKLVTAVETNGYECDIQDISVNDNAFSCEIGHYQPKTFALTFADEKTALCKTFSAVKLPYNRKVTSENGVFECDIDISLPTELFPDQIVSSGIPFSMGPADVNNAVFCKGQVLSLPENTQTLYILAHTFCDEHKETAFSVNGNPVPVTVSNACQMVGTWDMIAQSNTCYLNRDEIAMTFTHTHDRSGDRAYDFAYLFKYAIPVNGAKEITLPAADDKIVVFAATAAFDTVTTKALTPLYPVAEKNAKPTYTLNVNGGTETHILAEDAYALITSTDSDPEALFECWMGDAIVSTKGTTALVRMPDHDVEIHEKKRYLGKNLSLNMPTDANLSENSDETPAHAVNGVYDQKWCALVEEDSPAWMSIDLGAPKSISRWLVKHAGQLEGSSWNTKDFKLEFKLNENDTWTELDSVIGNKDDITVRDIPTTLARFVRLVVTNPSQDGDPHARIYTFAVFEV